MNPTSQGDVNCDWRAHRSDIIREVNSLARTRNFNIDQMTDRPLPGAFLIVIETEFGDIVIGPYGDAKVQITHFPESVFDSNLTKSEELELTSFLFALKEVVSASCGSELR